MLGLTRTKTHQGILASHERQAAAREASLHANLVEKDKILNSTERLKVLGDLEEALCLIEAYQRSLVVLNASDPNIIRANAFLEQFNRKGAASATILGAQPRGLTKSEDIADRIVETQAPSRIQRELFVYDPDNAKSRWDQEEDYYGDEAYGCGRVGIRVEALDEGDEKEPGYTRARISFVDLDAPDDLVAKADDSPVNTTGHGSDGEGQ